jgi:hypothetical protein
MEDSERGIPAECPQCGALGLLERTARGTTFLRCPSCEGSFVLPDIDVPEAEVETPARPWYRDPILGTTALLCAFLSLGFLAYLISGRVREDRKRAILAAFDQARTLDREGQIEQAYARYLQVVDPVNADLGLPAESLAESKAAADRLSIEVDRLRARRAAEEAMRLAREKEAKERQKREAERARVEASLKGGAWVNKGLGSDVIRGMKVTVTKRWVTRGELSSWLNSVLLLDGSRVVRAMHEMDGSELIDLRKALSIAREESTIRRALRDSKDVARMLRLERYGWSELVDRFLVAEATTNIEGKYEIRSLKGGEYLVCGWYSNALSYIDWTVPLTIDESREYQLDLFNETAREIVNKSEDD